MLRYALACVILLVTGCGPTGFSLVDYEQAARSMQEIGEEYEVTAGSPMAVFESGYLLPTWVATTEYHPPAPGAEGGTAPEVAQGSEWRVAAEHKESGDVVIWRPDYIFDKTIYGIRIDRYGSPKGWHGVNFLSEGNMYLAPASHTRGQWTDERIFERGEPSMSTSGGFRAELVYSGQSENTLRVLYREYSDDMARPAFTQELTYDISNNPVIEFRSIRIEVLDAKSSRIKYKILDDGGLDWMPQG